MPTRSPFRLPDGALAAGLVLLAGAMQILLRAGLGLEEPGGSDPDLWVRSARNLQVGADPVVPPLFPSLIRLGLALGGDAVAVAAWIGALAHLLIGPVVLLLLRLLGAGRWLAGLAGLVSVSLPLVLVLGLKAQPDALVAVWLVAGSLAGHAWVGRPPGPAPGRFGLLLLFVALSPLLREHGLILGLLLCGLAALGGGRLVAGRVLLALLVLHLGPLLLGQEAGMLWKMPWNQRILMTVFGDAGGGLAYPEEVARTLLADGSEPGLGTRAWWAISRAPGGWSWVLLGLVGAAMMARIERSRLALAVGLLPSMGGLLTWSEPRHVAVAVPLGVGLWAAALATSGARGRLALGLLGLAGLGASTLDARFAFERLQTESRRVAQQRELGEALCEQVEPGDLGAGEGEWLLFCPLPVHEPYGTGADWRTWAVDRRPEGSGWRRVPMRGDVPVYRLVPELKGDRRPCAGSATPKDVPFAAAPVRPVELEPPCTGPDRWELDPARAGEDAEPSELELNRRRPRGRQP